MVITELEVLIGLPIWTAYVPVNDAAVKTPEKRKWWQNKRFAVAGVIALVVAAPLLTFDLEVFFLNLVRAGHRLAAAQAVPGAPPVGEVPALTASGRSQPIPTRRGPSPSGGGPSSLPASGCRRQGNKT